MPSELEDSHLHRVAGAQGRLLEHERHALAGQHLRWRIGLREGQHMHKFVDGQIVDLNRIPLPRDTKIIDNRFRKATKSE